MDEKYIGRVNAMKRKVFITAVQFCMVLVSSVFAQVGVRYDILLKGGHVIDPANRVEIHLRVHEVPCH